MHNTQNYIVNVMCVCAISYIVCQYASMVEITKNIIH